MPGDYFETLGLDVCHLRIIVPVEMAAREASPSTNESARALPVHWSAPQLCICFGSICWLGWISALFPTWYVCTASGKAACELLPLQRAQTEPKFWPWAYQRSVWGYRGQRVGEASHPGPGSKVTQRKRQEAELTDLIAAAIRLLLPRSNVNPLISLLKGVLGIGKSADDDAGGKGAGGDSPKPKKKKKTKRVVRTADKDLPPSSSSLSRASPVGATAKAGKGSDGRPPGGAAGGGPPHKASKGAPDAPPGSGKGKGPGAGNAQSGTAGSLARPAPVGRAKPAAQDWQGIVLSYEGFGEFTGDGASLLVFLESEHQVEPATLMANNLEGHCAVTLMWEDPAASTSVPLRLPSGVVLPRRVTCKDWKHPTVPLPSLIQAAKVKPKTVQVETTSVVRVVVAQLHTQPADFSAARANLRRFVTGRLQGVRDVWGAAEEQRHGTAIVALARVGAQHFEGALQKSGVDGLFVEPLAKKEGGETFTVDWQDGEDGTTRQQQLQKLVATKPRWGLVLGHRQLGIRKKVSDAAAIKAWRIVGTPVTWTQELVKELLAEQSALVNVEVTSRVVRNGRATWLLRAASAEDYACLCTQEGQAVARFWVTPAMSVRGQVKRKTLSVPPAQNFTREKFGMRQAPEPQDEKKADATSVDKQGEGPNKRRTIEQRALPKGVVLMPCEKDGNCLLHALGMGIAHNKGTAKRPGVRQLRAELVANMGKKADLYAGFWDGRDSNDDKDVLASFDDYLNEIKQDGKYLGHLELDAAAAMYNLTVYVVPLAPDAPPSRHGTGAFPIAMVYNQRHYDYLKPEADGYPAAITSISAFGSKEGGRGGGGDIPEEESHYALTVYTNNSAGEAVPQKARDRKAERVDPPPSLRSSSSARPVRLDGTANRGRGGRDTSDRKRPASPSGKGPGRAKAQSAKRANPTPSLRSSSSARPALPGGTATSSRSDQGQDASARDARDLRSFFKSDLGKSQWIGTDVESEGLPNLDNEQLPAPVLVGNERGRSRVRQLAGSRGAQNQWKCTECGFKTGKGAGWSRRKHAHIKTFHPELAVQLRERKVRALLVPWSSSCIWKCPIPGCGLGMATRESRYQLRHMVRMRHHREAHPTADPKLFHVKENSKGNATKATIAKRNKGVADRLAQLGIAKEAGHDPLWLSFPPPPGQGVRKKVERLIRRIYCTQCRQLDVAAKALAKRDCVISAAGGRRTMLLKRLESALKDELEDEVRAATEHALQVLRAAQDAVQQDRKRANKEHDLIAVVWPEDLSVKFICEECKGMWSQGQQLKSACSGVTVRRPKKQIAMLRSFLDTEGVKAKAARTALTALGVPAQMSEVKWSEERQSLARGLGAKVAP